MDYILIERDLVRQKQLISRHYELAKGPQARKAAAHERMTFTDTLAILEQHGGLEMKALVTRLREDY